MAEATEVLSVRMAASTVASFKEMAAQEGREPSEQLEYIIMEALIAAGKLPPDQAALHRLREDLIRRFLYKGVEIYTATPREDITAETAQQIVQDAGWKDDYDEYLKARDRNTINPILGRRLKLRLKLKTGSVFTVPQPSIFGTASYLLPAE